MNRRDRKDKAKETGSINGSPCTDPQFEEISRRAYELYEHRGEAYGHDVEDWLEAERQLRMETPAEAQEKDGEGLCS